MTEPINNPRAAIDAIDDELLRLLNRRAEIALRVGAVKQHTDASFCDPNREREVLDRLSGQNTGPLDEQNVKNIFQAVINECLHVQQRAFQVDEQAENEGEAKNLLLARQGRIAFNGEIGAFSHEAAIGLLGREFEPVACQTFEELFASIGEGRADYILAPLENSLVGSVHRCYDLLLESSFSIVAEAILPVSHCLIACPGASLETVRTVESHPVALAQCERFFMAHPHLKREAANDTAGSVRHVIESGDLTRAAIAGRQAAGIYGGVILKEHLEDHRENYTRFALLAANPEPSEQGEKISLVIRLPHRPGALHDALRPFVRRGVDLIKIESRPIAGRPWQYNFYLDLQVPARESELRGALDEIREHAEEMRFLGRYSSRFIKGDE